MNEKEKTTLILENSEWLSGELRLLIGPDKESEAISLMKQYESEKVRILKNPNREQISREFPHDYVLGVLLTHMGTSKEKLPKIVERAYQMARIYFDPELKPLTVKEGFQ